MFCCYQQTSQLSKDPDTMDMDRLAVEIQRLSFDEQKRLMEKDLCFGCKKPGHFVINCPHKKKHPAKEKQQGYKGKGKPKAHTTLSMPWLMNYRKERWKSFKLSQTTKDLDLKEKETRIFDWNS